MRSKGWFLLGVVLFLLPSVVLSQAVRPEPGRRPEALQVLALDMFPDPAREGQRIRFSITLLNRTSYSGRANLFIRDQDGLVVETRGALLQPGNNRVDFPDTGYRFSRRDPCFTVEVDIAGTKRPVDFARGFCAHRTSAGWTLSQVSVGPFLTEDLEMVPDPARPGQEVRFKVRLRNGGTPIRGNIGIRDKDEFISWVQDVRIEPGSAEYQFPGSGYTLQRFDHCFGVAVEAEGKRYETERAREFCARPLGWTLRP